MSSSIKFCEGCPFASGVGSNGLKLEQAVIDCDRGVANRWVDANGNVTPWVRIMTNSDGFGSDEFQQTAASAEARVKVCSGPEGKKRALGIGTKAVCGAFGTHQSKSPIYGLGFYDL